MCVCVSVCLDVSVEVRGTAHCVYVCICVRAQTCTHACHDVSVEVRGTATKVGPLLQHTIYTPEVELR